MVAQTTRKKIIRKTEVKLAGGIKAGGTDTLPKICSKDDDEVVS